MSDPSMNMDVPLSASGTYPHTRDTPTIHGQTSYGGLGYHIVPNESQNMGYVDLQNPESEERDQQDYQISDNRNLESFAHSLNINTVCASQTSTVDSISHQTESCSRQDSDLNLQSPTPVSESERDRDGSLASQQYCNISGTPQCVGTIGSSAMDAFDSCDRPAVCDRSASRKTGRVVTDSKPIDYNSVHHVAGITRLESADQDQVQRFQGPPVTPKVEEKLMPFPRQEDQKMGKHDVPEYDKEDKHNERVHGHLQVNTPDAITVTDDRGRLNINITNTNTVQIGNNNKMVVYQQPGGINQVVMSDSKAKPGGTTKAKVTLEVAKRHTRTTDFELVSDHLGRDWRRLGTTLGLNRGELDILDHDNSQSGLREIIYQMLLRWQSNTATRATLHALVSALVKIKRADIAKKFTD